LRSGKFRLIPLLTITCVGIVSASNESTLSEVIVQPNDTLTSILIRSYISPSRYAVAELKFHNNIQSRQLIAGRTLIIPNSIRNQLPRKTSATDRKAPNVRSQEITTKVVAKHDPGLLLESQQFLKTQRDNLKSAQPAPFLIPAIKNNSVPLSFPRNADERQNPTMIGGLNYNFSFLPTKYIENSTTRTNSLYLSAGLDNHHLSYGFDIAHHFSSSLSGLQNHGLITNVNSDLFLKYPSTMEHPGFGLHYLHEQYFGDTSHLNAVLFELPITSETAGAVFSYQNNERTWNVLEEYKNIDDIQSSFYNTETFGFDLHINPYSGIQASTEAGLNRAEKFKINKISGWIYPADTTLISLTKTNQPEYQDITAYFEYSPDELYSTTFYLELGTMSDTLTFTHGRKIPVKNMEIQVKLVRELSEQNNTDFAVMFSRID